METDEIHFSKNGYIEFSLRDLFGEPTNVVVLDENGVHHNLGKPVRTQQFPGDVSEFTIAIPESMSGWHTHSLIEVYVYTQDQRFRGGLMTDDEDWDHNADLRKKLTPELPEPVVKSRKNVYRRSVKLWYSPTNTPQMNLAIEAVRNHVEWITMVLPQLKRLL